MDSVDQQPVTLLLGSKSHASCCHSEDALHSSVRAVLLHSQLELDEAGLFHPCAAVSIGDENERLSR